jgi:hypothetical protein
MLHQYMSSPFKDDRKFAIQYIVDISRDELTEKEKIIESSFYDTVFNILLLNDDQREQYKNKWLVDLCKKNNHDDYYQ